MARKMLSVTLALATLLALIPVSSTATQRVGSGQVAGMASAHDGRALASQTVQLRDLATAAVVSSTVTNDLGEFAFTGVAIGAYVVEVTEAGRVVAASGVVMLTPQAPVMTGLTLVAVASIEGGAGSASFWTSAAGQIIFAAIVAGAVTAVVVAAHDTVASPSE